MTFGFGRVGATAHDVWTFAKVTQKVSSHPRKDHLDGFTVILRKPA